MVAEQKKILKLLKTAKGQLEGIIKMVEADQYCIDISHQLMATEAIVNKINKEVLTAHLKACVNKAETEIERDQKVDEFVGLLGKVMR